MPPTHCSVRWCARRGHRARDLNPDLTRLLARIHEWQEGHGKAGGRADAARRLDEANNLLDEVSNMLAEMRRTMMSGATK